MSYPHPEIEVVAYDLVWPQLFELEAAKMKRVLGADVPAIHHMGSTAIPGIAAKPVIDILLECENLDDIERISSGLESLGYGGRRRQVIPHRSFFMNKIASSVSYNLHIRERGDTQVVRHLRFLDYMRHHPEEMMAYGELKKQLAQQFSHDIEHYILGKNDFVHDIDIKAKAWAKTHASIQALKAPRGLLKSSAAQDAIIKAMETNLNIHMTHFAQYLSGFEIMRIPAYTLINSGLTDDTFNYITDVDLSAEDIPQRINEVIRYFKNRKLPFSWWVGPSCLPANLPKHLEEAGFENSENNIGMFFDLNQEIKNEAPQDLKFVRAESEKHFSDFAEVLFNSRDAYQRYFSAICSARAEDDPFEFYVGYVGEKPVTRGVLVFDSQVAGIQYVSTAQDERRKGYGTAMECFLMQRAKELTYEIVVLQASAEGRALYERLGFQACCVFREFKLNTEKESVNLP